MFNAYSTPLFFIRRSTQWKQTIIMCKQRFNLAMDVFTKLYWKGSERISHTGSESSLSNFPLKWECIGEFAGWHGSYSKLWKKLARNRWSNYFKTVRLLHREIFKIFSLITPNNSKTESLKINVWDRFRKTAYNAAQVSMRRVLLLLWERYMTRKFKSNLSNSSH